MLKPVFNYDHEMQLPISKYSLDLFASIQYTYIVWTCACCVSQSHSTEHTMWTLLAICTFGLCNLSGRNRSSDALFQHICTTTHSVCLFVAFSLLLISYLTLFLFFISYVRSYHISTAHCTECSILRV